MAAPKVFVSSTCFDLSEIRGQLKRFIESFGFDPVLSEHGDVFYHPELHTHESCIHEVSNTQLFILIIGGRYGGEYVSDKNKSITNAEYSAARKKGIPVFAYIRDGVLANHYLYQQNKKKDFVSEIEYPSIEKQKYAIDIFSFIDEVRRSPVNNAFEGFETFQDIEEHLRKQWAGMFFELLRSKEVKQQIDNTNHHLDGLASTAGKLEELVKSLYLSSDKAAAQTKIEEIDVYSDLVSFYEQTLTPRWFVSNNDSYVNFDINYNQIASIQPNNDNWHGYLVETDLFFYSDFDSEDDSADFRTDEFTAFSSVTFDGYDKSSLVSTFYHPTDKPEFQQLYKVSVVKSTVEQRTKALSSVLNRHLYIPF